MFSKPKKNDDALQQLFTLDQTQREKAELLVFRFLEATAGYPKTVDKLLGYVLYAIDHASGVVKHKISEYAFGDNEKTPGEYWRTSLSRMNYTQGYQDTIELLAFRWLAANRGYYPKTAVETLNIVAGFLQQASEAKH